jgi:hypothetical protein
VNRQRSGHDASDLRAKELCANFDGYMIRQNACRPEKAAASSVSGLTT